MRFAPPPIRMSRPPATAPLWWCENDARVHGSRRSGRAVRPRWPGTANDPQPARDGQRPGHDDDRRAVRRRRLPDGHRRIADPVPDSTMDDGRDPGHLRWPASGPHRQPGRLRAQPDASHDRLHADTGDRAMNSDSPFRVDDSQRTATATLYDHVRDKIEQLVFTGPGGEVNPVPPSGRSAAARLRTEQSRARLGVADPGRGGAPAVPRAPDRRGPRLGEQSAGAPRCLLTPALICPARRSRYGTNRLGGRW
jgi:hypothetical protein